jgi:hypothetical protein
MWTNPQVKETFDALDEDGSGQLELDEVLAACRAPMCPSARSRMYACALGAACPEHRVVMHQIARLAEALGINLTREQCMEGTSSRGQRSHLLAGCYFPP